MEKVLSIIIPTYNAEEFLDKGLASFVIDDMNQMSKLEVLVINDGTPDNSVAVAQKYVAQYPDTFQIINKENGGHGSAINVGVQQATGKYFKVVDADDWVDTKALERLLICLENTTCDAMIQSFCTYDISKESNQLVHYNMNAIQSLHVEPYTLAEIMEHWDELEFLLTFHGVLYQTEFYRKQNYNVLEHVFYEDQEYATIPLCRAQQICLLNDEFYIYRIGDVNQSVSAQSQIKRIDHAKAVIFRMLEFEKQVERLPAGGKEYWSMKTKKFINSVYQIMLIRNPDKKSHRSYAEAMQNQIKKVSPYMDEQTKKQYQVFKMLNHLHMNENIYQRVFLRMLNIFK